MNAVEGGKNVLEKILENLGFEADVHLEESSEGPILQIQSEDGRHLIGKGGDRLDDLQYLVNRIVQKHLPDAPRIRVDCDSYRENQEKRLIDKAVELAEKALETGQQQETRPLNAYHRRIVHNALIDKGVSTESQGGATRYKKIFIKVS